MKINTILCLLLWPVWLLPVATGSANSCGWPADETMNSTRTSSVSSTPLSPATATGWATWYSTNSCKLDDAIRGVPPRSEFRTASGALLDDSALSCALPLETARVLNIRYGDNVRVTSLATSRTVTVKYLDRGPGRKSRSRGVIVDLSVAGMLALAGEKGIEAGRVKIKLEAVK